MAVMELTLWRWEGLHIGVEELYHFIDGFVVGLLI